MQVGTALSVLHATLSMLMRQSVEIVVFICYETISLVGTDVVAVRGEFLSDLDQFNSSPSLLLVV